jgi:hypothetical protein
MLTVHLTIKGLKFFHENHVVCSVPQPSAVLLVWAWHSIEKRLQTKIKKGGKKAKTFMSLLEGGGIGAISNNTRKL